MEYPDTPQQTATDTYNGVRVEDPYRWLENAGDTQVREWTQAQNQITREFLDRVPFREKIHAEVKRLLSASSPEYYSLKYAGGKLFALKRQPPLQQPLLVSLSSEGDIILERDGEKEHEEAPAAPAV